MEHPSMSTPPRLLALLAAPDATHVVGPRVADRRCEPVTRAGDVDRLRDLGYPVEGTSALTVAIASGLGARCRRSC